MKFSGTSYFHFWGDYCQDFVLTVPDETTGTCLAAALNHMCATRNTDNCPVSAYSIFEHTDKSGSSGWRMVSKGDLTAVFIRASGAVLEHVRAVLELLGAVDTDSMARSCDHSPEWTISIEHLDAYNPDQIALW